MIKNYSKINFIITYIGVLIIGIFLGGFLCANMPALKSELRLPSLTTTEPELLPSPTTESGLLPPLPSEIVLPPSLPDIDLSPPLEEIALAPLPTPLPMTESMLPPPISLPEPIETEEKKAQEMITANMKFKTSCDTVNLKEKCWGRVGNVTIAILDQNGNLIASLITDENGTAESDLILPPDMRFAMNRIKSMQSTVTIVALKKGYVPMVYFDVRVGFGGQNKIFISMKLAVGNLRLDEPKWAPGRNFHRLEAVLVANNVVRMLNFDL